MLQRPWLTPIVVVFWCVTSGWLLVDKILPSLAPGSPPGSQAHYASGKGLIPVAWTVQWNNQPIGWALAETQHTPLGGLLVDSRLHFEKVPLDEIMPAWTRLLVRNVLPAGGWLTFDSRGRITIDASGNLRSFMSIVNVPGSAERVLLNGIVDRDAVRVHVQAGELRHETIYKLPAGVMVGDELSPQATMPGLYTGRRWSVPVYSPLRAANSPIEILHAEVGPEETVYHDGHLVRVHVVSYREDPSSHREPRCVLWVDRSGRVLKQEAMVLGSKLAFVRETDESAARRSAEQAEAGRSPDDRRTMKEVSP